MMYDLALAITPLAAIGIAALATIYLWSASPGCRARAWNLLKLLLRSSEPGHSNTPKRR